MSFLNIAGACALAGLTAFPLAAAAQEFSVLEQRLLEHPTLTQLSHQASASREQATAAYALPDPELSLGINNVPVSDPSFDRYLPSNKAVGILQNFPNKAGRMARRAQLRTQANQAEALRAAYYAELRGQLLADLIEIERIETERELVRARNHKYDELADIVRSEIDAGRPALFRLAEIEGERAEVARLLVELDGQEAQILAAITEKVGPVTEPGLPDVALINWSGDPQQFHAVRVASHAAEAAGHGVDEAQAAWKTSWGMHLTYQQRSSSAGNNNSMFDGDDWFSAGIKFSIPVWGSKKQAPNVRAAELHRTAATLQTASQARSATAKYESLLAQRSTAKASQRIFTQKISAIESEISAQQSNYESGRGDYAPIIDGEIAILTLRAHIASQRARALSATARANALLVTP